MSRITSYEEGCDLCQGKLQRALQVRSVDQYSGAIGQGYVKNGHFQEHGTSAVLGGNRPM